MSIVTTRVVAAHTPSHESLLRRFRSRSGLYVLGAGVSAGIVPFGPRFLGRPAVDYVHGGSFPAIAPQQSELTQRSVAALLNLKTQDRHQLIYGDREIRPGTVEFPYEELLRRQPDFYTRVHLKHLLAEPRYRRQQSDNYLAFRLFRRSVILNYNLDGLESDTCGVYHKVVAAHGTIEHGYGSPSMAKYLSTAREFDLPVPSDDQLICLAESYADLPLRQRLSQSMSRQTNFVAVIGYSFGRNGYSHDDRVSWDIFCERFYRFPGDIYVIDPHPDELRGRIAEATKSNNVVGIRAYWNVLAHAFAKASRETSPRMSLNYLCECLLDAHGDGVAFPRSGELPHL